MYEVDMNDIIKQISLLRICKNLYNSLIINKELLAHPDINIE